MANQAYVNFRVSAADYKELKERAKFAGKSISAYCREIVFTFDKKQIPSIEFPDGTVVEASLINKGRLIFVGAEYENQKAAGNGEKAEKVPVKKE